MKSPSHVYAKLLTAIAEGATLITANRRLATTLQQTYASSQSSDCWPSPDILPLNNWLLRLWQQAQADQLVPMYAVLNEYQSLLVWQQIISDSADGQHLLNVHAAAQQAYKTWRLCQQWAVDISDSEQHFAHGDFAIWLQWAHSFQDYCQTQQVLDDSRLAGELCQADLSQLRLGKPLMLVGLDEIPNQIKSLLDQVAALGCQLELFTPAFAEPEIQTLALHDTHSELVQMAHWAKTYLHEHPDAQLACIVPNLTDLREQIHTLFAQTLNPVASLQQQTDYTPIYNISAGKRLLSYPLMHCAYLILKLGRENLNLTELSGLLRSPYLAGHAQEQGARHQLDAVLRDYGEHQISLASLLNISQVRKRFGRCIHCPVLHSSLQALHAQTLPTQAYPSEWAVIFAKQLQCFTWPGEQALDTHDYQLVQRAQEMLQEFAAFDSLCGQLTHAQALYQWHQYASTIIFQFKSAEPQVHILGTLEAVGLTFDAVWIMGLHDGAWPAAVKPNPFLPLALQRQTNLPQSSAKRELAFTRQLMQRLTHCAQAVILSYPTSDGSNPLHASPLLAPYRQGNPAQTPLTLNQRLFVTSDREYFSEANPIALQADEKVTGGSRVLKLQALCPFRAFAELRLNAHGLGQSHSGFDALERGSLIHRALELIWQQLRDQQHLLRLGEQQLTELIQSHTHTSLNEFNQQRLKPISQRLLQLEQLRMQTIIQAWLTLEKQRAPFAVLATEQRSKIEIGDLQLNVMLDRIDRAGDQRYIIDYKTGSTSLYAWFDERPSEPQLPLYCITSPENVDGILFAELRANKLQFKGIIADPERVPNSIAPEDLTDETLNSWSKLNDYWREHLTVLAHDFCQGDIRVAPKHPLQTCQYCELHSLCRVGEHCDE